MDGRHFRSQQAMQAQQLNSASMHGEGVSISPSSNVKQHVDFIASQLEELEMSVNALAEAMDRAGILSPPGPEAPIAGMKGPDPNCPLSGALHELARRVEHRAYTLRDMRSRLAA